MKIHQLDHVAIHVQDVKASQQFYAEVLKLEAKPRPGFDFEGAWFRLGKTQELHLIGNRKHEVVAERRGDHFALQIDNVDEWEAWLNEKQVDILRKRRPDNAHQIFLQDPDGHWIELCCPE